MKGAGWHAGGEIWRGLGRPWGAGRGSAAGSVGCGQSTRVLAGRGVGVHLWEPERNERGPWVCARHTPDRSVRHTASMAA